MHMFDIDIPGKVTFKESDIYSAGEEMITISLAKGFDEKWYSTQERYKPLRNDTRVDMAVCICFDIRFYVPRRPMSVLICPAVFSPTTGALHWETLLRTRAVDLQCWVIGVSSAASPKCYGHSIVVDPWGNVTHDMGEEEGVAVIDVDLSEADKVKKEIPIQNKEKTWSKDNIINLNGLDKRKYDSKNNCKISDDIQQILNEIESPNKKENEVNIKNDKNIVPITKENLDNLERKLSENIIDDNVDDNAENYNG